MSDLEDQRRFEVSPVGAHGYDAHLGIRCTRCGWAFDTDWEEPITLAELVQRTAEHSTTCP